MLMAEPEKSFTDYLKSYVGLNNEPETDVEEPSQLDIFGIPLGSTLDDANLNLESFTLPMTASGSDQKISEDDAGHPVFRSKLDGSTYTIMYKEDQRTDLIKIKEDVIPAVKEYAEDPFLPTGEQVVDATKAVAGSIYDTISIPGDVASGERNLSDVTMGDVYGIAGSGGAMSTLGRAPANSLRTFGGPAAKDYDNDDLARALDMQKRGASEEEIFEATGRVATMRGGKSEYGFGEQLKFEIDDSKIKINKTKPQMILDYLKDINKFDSNYIPDLHMRTFSVDELIPTHTELFEQYPNAKNITVRFLNPDKDSKGVTPIGRDAGAHYNPSTKEIVLKAQSIKNFDSPEFRTTFFHELQHALQAQDAFVTTKKWLGGGPDNVIKNLSNSQWEGTPYFLQNLSKDKKILKIREDLYDISEQYYNNPSKSTGKKLARKFMELKNQSFEVYMRTGEEVEARLAGNRSKFSYSNNPRKKTSLPKNLKREEKIISRVSYNFNRPANFIDNFVSKLDERLNDQSMIDGTSLDRNLEEALDFTSDLEESRYVLSLADTDPYIKKDLRTRYNFSEGGSVSTKITAPVDTGEKTISGRTIWNDPETGEDYSERSTTFEIDGKYYTMPTVSEDGRQHSEDQIRDYVKKHGPVDYLTGEKLPEFRYMEDALEYAKSRSSTRKQTAAGMSEGGSMARQMKMFEEGGIADDGMSRDPISGNEIPSGSLAEEVRDDIPAQLSEGEYVVPADVVRYFGVRVFEDMRMEAKMGLQKMEQDGRIGGEPIDTPAVRSNTDDLSPEEQKLLQEIMAMEQPQEQPAGFAPGGYAGTLGGSYIGSNTDSIFSPTKTQDQFKTLGGSYLQTGSTGAPTMEGGMEGGVEPVAPVVNKVCPPGQIFSEKSQMCIISPGTYKNNDDDGGKTVIPEPEDWGDDIDWTYSEGMTGYVDSVLTPMDKGLQKGLQIGGAMAGGFLGLGVGLLPVADALNDLSNARATSLIARAMGDTATADAIDAKIDVYVKKAPAIATSWLGNWLSSGTSRAGYLARKAGFDSLEDAAANPDAFRKALGGTTTTTKKEKKPSPQTQEETQAIIDKSAGLTLLQSKQRIESQPLQDQINIIKSSDKGDERYEKALKKATKIASEKKKTADKEQDKIQKAIDSGSIKKELAPTRNQSGEFGMKKGGLIARPKKKTKKKK